MVEDISTKHKINIDIKIPCAKKGEDQFIKIDNQFGHGKRYEYVNYRSNHVEALQATYKDIKNAIDVSRDKIIELIREYTFTDRFCEWSCDSLGPVCVCTATETYRCNVQFGEKYTDFNQQFSGFRIDHNVDTISVRAPPPDDLFSFFHYILRDFALFCCDFCLFCSDFALFCGV